MALICCPECSKEVSNTAFTCPHCGFNIANYMQETERKRREIEEEHSRQLRLEKRQQKRQELVEKAKKCLKKSKERKSVMEQIKLTCLKQQGKKALWIFAAILPYSVIATIMGYIQDYIIRKQLGLLYGNENFFAWYFRNWGAVLPMQTLAFAIILLVPSILYAIANNIKNIKIAKILLAIALLYNVILFLLSIISGLNYGYINIGMIVRFFIPLVAYIVLCFKITHIKK